MHFLLVVSDEGEPGELVDMRFIPVPLFEPWLIPAIWELCCYVALMVEMIWRV
jgi:hypothetical protein